MAIIQGRSVHIKRDSSWQHAGGGKRGRQRGHGYRSELRLYNKLCTFLPCRKIIWLTYSDVRGPEDCHKHLKSFFGRLQRHFEIPMGAIARMEAQRRLSPDLCMLIWYEPFDLDINGELVASLWSKTSKQDSRVKVENYKNWLALIRYVAKRMELRDDGILIGSKLSSYEFSPYGGDSFKLILGKWLSYIDRL